MRLPTKTIYIAESELPLYQQAQELTGGNLSAAITTALRRYLAAHAEQEAGYEEVTVTVGIGRAQKRRFRGILLAEWAQAEKDRLVEYRVYRTPKGNFAVYLIRSPTWVWTADTEAEGWKGTIRAHLGFADHSWGSTPATATLDVFPTLEELRKQVPADLYTLVASMPDPTGVEELDI